MQNKPKLSLDAAELRRRAEACLPKQRKTQRAEVDGLKSAADTQRMLHELQVHQIELEMQNAEIQECWDRNGVLLEKYTDLYDFAPVGYFSLDGQGRILEVNLTGSTLLGVARSRLIKQPLPRFVALSSRPVFLDFLKKVCAGDGKQVCEAKLKKEDGTLFWASLHGASVYSSDAPQKGCRVVVSDITSLKQAQETQHRVEVLAASNEELKREIVRRQAVEEALKKSEQHKSELLEQARHMQVQLRDLSHRILQVQEEERKRISRELHDEITQTLVSINVHLDSLALATKINPVSLKQKTIQTQRLVEKSVSIVHQYARDLRPTALDDLGLIITLHSFLNDFLKKTGIHVQFTTFAGVEQLNSDRRTVLYRIVQEALANVAQHANASRVKVSIHKIAEDVLLEISDNGQAFDVERALNAKRNKRLGLIGMRERAEMIGGTFAVESVAGQGTTVRAQIPFNNGTLAKRPSARRVKLAKPRKQ